MRFGKKNSKNGEINFPHVYPQYLLWEEQQKHDSYSDSKTMK